MEGSSGYIDLMCSQLQPRATFKELLEGLIQNSRDVRAVGEHEMTALHYSVLVGHLGWAVCRSVLLSSSFLLALLWNPALGGGTDGLKVPSRN